MDNIITGQSYRREHDVVVANKVICTISYNPKSELFGRNVARLLQALSGLAKTRNIKIPDLPNLPEEENGAADEQREAFADALERAAEPLGKFADAYDVFIAAADKIGGCGVTEAILDEDDEKLTLFSKAFAPIFEEYNKQRRAKTNKYRANPQV